jgi:hypothetical protein
MAITVKLNQTGAGWATSGTPTNATLGLLVDVGTTDGGTPQAGTFTPWSTATRRDTQPSGVTSASFVELSSTGFCNQTILQDSVTDSDFATGVMMDYWMQFKLHSAYDEATPTPPNNTIEELWEVTDGGAGGTGGALFYLRANSRNVVGFAPGVYLTVAGQTLAAADWNAASLRAGAGTTIPTGNLKLDEWYRVKVWMKRSATTSSNDGKLRVWINDVMIVSTDVADAFWAASPTQQRYTFLRMFNGWGGITGIRLRYAGPVRVRVMDEADIEAPDQSHWEANTELDYSLRRHWSAKYTGYGTPWTISGALAASVPARGTNYSSSGVQPGGSYLAIPVTAGNGVNLDTPNIWDGSTCDPRDSESGLTHVVFQDIMAAAGAAITGTVYTSNNTDTIVTWQVDATAGKFYVNGAEVYTGLSDSIRWKVICTIGGGRCTVTLQDQTSNSFSATSCRSADYAYQNGYTDGAAIGKARIVPVGASSETIHVGAVSVYARLDAPLVNSYWSADAGSTPAYQCLGQRYGQNLNQHDDSTVPGGYDPVPYAGGITGIDMGLNMALSGAKLSEFVTHVMPTISAIRGVRWFLIGDDVNDIPASGAITNMANAWDAANTIVDRKETVISWAIARGHQVYVGDSLNLANASTFAGAANSYRRKIPGMVAQLLLARLSRLSNTQGKVFYVPTQWAVDGNDTSIAPGDIHPANGYDTKVIRAAHDSSVNITDMPGWSTDGSVDSTSSSSNSRSDRHGRI